MSIEQRLARLERENRFLKYCAGGLAIAASCGFAAFQPGADEKREADDEPLKTVVVKNEAAKPLPPVASGSAKLGNVQAASIQAGSIKAGAIETESIVVRSASGSKIATLGVDENGSAFVLYHQDSKQAELRAGANQSGLTLSDNGGKLSLSQQKGGGQIALESTAAGNKRGVRIATDEDKAVLELKDRGGNVTGSLSAD